MLKIIDSILDILFPPRETEILIRNKTESKQSLPYTQQLINETIVLSDYHEPIIRAAILENKFHNNERAQKLLAELLTTYLLSVSTPTLLIPIPLSKKREKTRGYNQVTQVLTMLKLPNITIARNILYRHSDTKPQTDLHRNERLKNVAGAFHCHNPHLLTKTQYQHVFLIDDVLTTGATMHAAHAALAPVIPSSTKLTRIAFAH